MYKFLHGYLPHYGRASSLSLEDELMRIMIKLSMARINAHSEGPLRASGYTSMN